MSSMDAAIATTGLEPAPAAPAPFVGLRRAYYGAIAVDPASHFSSYTAIQSQNWSSRRDNERHYRTMSFDELAALPIKQLAAPFVRRTLLRISVRSAPRWARRC